MKNQLEDYNVHKTNIPVMCDNSATIIDLQFISIEDELADIFTKSLVEERFVKLRQLLGMIFIEE